MRALVLSLAVVGLVGCSNDFEAQTQLKRVRVLAIRADPPQLIVPTDGSAPVPVQLTPLAVNGDGGAVAVRFALCSPYANPTAADFACPGKDGVDLRGGTLSLLDPAVQGLLGAGGDGGTPDLAVLQAGVDLTVGYEATDGSPGERGVERGTRSVQLIATDAPNHNPKLLDITTQGNGIQGVHQVASATVPLGPLLADGSAETYTTASGAHTEALFYSWFATGDGKLANLRSQEPVDGVGVRTVDYTTPDHTTDVTVYLVVRDGRGGEDWVARTLSVVQTVP
jgi:hypothetical protein